MDQQKILFSNSTKKYILRIKEKLNQSRNAMLATVNSFPDDKNIITISMDNTQVIHSIYVSESIFDYSDKKELCNHLKRSINNAIFNSSLNGVIEVKNYLSHKEYYEHITTETKEVIDKLGLININYKHLLREINDINLSFVSSSGNILLVISGTQNIQSLTITDKILLSNNKEYLERELKDTLNKAIETIQKIIQGRIIKNEEEFNELLN